MLANRFFRSLVLLTAIGAVAAAAQVFMPENLPPALEISVKPIPQSELGPNDLSLDVVFEKKGKEPVRILRIFEDPRYTKIFFSVTWYDVGGTPIFSSGGGKIALSERSAKYIVLDDEKDRYSARINLREYLPVKEPLKPGLYKVSITYRNQYGENCFKGRLESNQMDVVLND